MSNYFGISILIFCLVSANCFADFRAMTINTEWLWTPFDNRVDGSLSHLTDMTVQAYREEVDFYVQQIKAKSIDIVALGEIENKYVAEDLVHALGKDWKVYFKQGRDTATGQDVAIISKLPYIEGSLTDFGFPSGSIYGAGKPKKLSKIVGAQFLLTKKVAEKMVTIKLGVITAHLLSKRYENKKKATNRKKQALGLKKAIDTYSHDTDALIVMGDFNDYLNSDTLKIITNKRLDSYKKCMNFSKKTELSRYKKWQRHIDHLLYSGLSCSGQYKLDLQRFSDHPAIYGEFMFHQSR